MIIYGTRSTGLKSITLPNEACPNCNTKGMMMMSVFNKYAHIFWIPTFPLGKKGGSQCQQCGQVLEPRSMPPFLKMQYDQLVAQTRIPLWSWIGLAGIVVIVISVARGISVDNENDRLFINNPVAGDIYEFKTETNSYSLMKVVEVTPDSIMIQYNEYEVDKMSGVYKLHSKPFAEDYYMFSRKDILGMFESKKIFDVDRK